jgi:hypothetical protein
MIDIFVSKFFVVKRVFTVPFIFRRPKSKGK